MSVKAQTLENQERDLALSNREEDPKSSKRESLTAELKAIRERIDRAGAADRSKILRHDKRPHCGDCFARGWAAAVAEIEGDPSP